MKTTKVAVLLAILFSLFLGSSFNGAVFAAGLQGNVALPQVFEREQDGLKVREILYLGLCKKVEYFDLKTKICVKKQDFDVAGVLVLEKNFNADGKLTSDTVVQADKRKFLHEYDAASGNLTKSQEQAADGTLVAEKNFNAAGKLLSNFVLRDDKSKLYQDFNVESGKLTKSRELRADGTLVAEKNFDAAGKLMNDFVLRDDNSTLRQEYDVKTGGLVQSKAEYPGKKVVKTIYRPDGKSPFIAKIMLVDADKDWQSSHEYFAVGGRHLKRDTYSDRMIVSVFNKDNVLQYTQRWNLDGEYFRLAEVTVFSGTQKQVISLKADGITVDKVEHLVSGVAGWTSQKVEPGDKLEKPVDESLLKELNRADDPTAPELAPAPQPAPVEEKNKTEPVPAPASAAPVEGKK